jgi:hypothetical protein
MPSFSLRFAILAALLLVQACTTIRVDPALPASPPIEHVCIENNPKVVVKDFVPILQEAFESHRISTEVYTSAIPDNCQFIVTYTALQSWDIVRYLAHAEVRVLRSGILVAYGEFHLVGGGGYALTKYKSTREKMDSVMDKLLAGYH